MTHGECTDDRLLALLDGELPDREARQVRRHLEACWQCRARLAEWEQDVHSVARACRGGVWYSPSALERARRKLHAAIAAEPLSRPRSQWWRLAPFAAASMAFAGGAVWYATRPAPIASVPAAQTVAARRMPPALPAAAPAVPESKPLPRRETASPLAADVTPALLDAHEALHRAGVCLREPAVVRIENGRILVRVVAPSAERRAEIEAEVSLPGVDLEVKSMDEASHPRQEVVFVPGSAREPAKQRIPIHDEVAARLHSTGDGAARDVKDFADAVLRASEAMNLQHHALLALAEAFPPAIEAQLPGSDRDRLKALVASHQRQMSDAMRLLRTTLRPVLDIPEASPVETTASWQLGIRVSQAAELHRTIMRLFAISIAAPSGEPATLAQLESLLAQGRFASAAGPDW